MSALVVTRTQRHRIVGFAVALLLVGVVAISIGDRDSLTSPDSELPSAEFALFDGTAATFSDFEGKPLVINFWASWCPACVNELPDIQTIHERVGDDVAFLGLANADSREAAESLAAEVGLTYTLADDPEGELFRSLDLIAMPTTLFITAEGQVSEVFGGQLTESALTERVEQLRNRS